jgi:hypothetical protein
MLFEHAAMEILLVENDPRDVSLIAEARNDD